MKLPEMSKIERKWLHDLLIVIPTWIENELRDDSKIIASKIPYHILRTENTENEWEI